MYDICQLISDTEAVKKILEQLFPKLSNIYLNRYIKSVSELNGQMLYYRLAIKFNEYENVKHWIRLSDIQAEKYSESFYYNLIRPTLIRVRSKYEELNQ
jgi:hypothetical protein